MKVERIDVFDFKLVLDERDFNGLKYISDNTGLDIEPALQSVIVNGIDKAMECIQKKET